MGELLGLLDLPDEMLVEILSRCEWLSFGRLFQCSKSLRHLAERVFRTRVQSELEGIVNADKLPPFLVGKDSIPLLKFVLTSAQCKDTVTMLCSVWVKPNVNDIELEERRPTKIEAASVTAIELDRYTFSSAFLESVLRNNATMEHIVLFDGIVLDGDAENFYKVIVESCPALVSIYSESQSPELSFLTTFIPKMKHLQYLCYPNRDWEVGEIFRSMGFAHVSEVVNIIPYMPEMTKEKYAKHFWPHIESEYSPSRFYGRSAVKDGR